MNHEKSSRSSRRTFIQQSSVGLAALSTSLANQSLSQAATPLADSGWIDAHVHVWTPDTVKYPLGPDFSVPDMQPGSFTAEELFGNCRPAGVTRVVLIQMSFYQYDHSYMLDVMQAHPGVFSGVALIDHRSADLVPTMHALAGKGMRGFRIYGWGEPPNWVDEPGMLQLWRTAGEAGLAVCTLIDPQAIASVEAMCQKFPETTVVVDHFARIGVDGTLPKDQIDALCRLAKFPKTYLKTSAFYALGKKAAPYDDLIPMIRRVYDSYGPQRLMWASDCPFQVQGGHTYEASIALVRDRIDFLSDSDKQWMLRGTAEKVYFS